MSFTHAEPTVTNNNIIGLCPRMQSVLELGRVVYEGGIMEQDDLSFGHYAPECNPM